MGAGLVCQSFCENQPPDLRLGGFLPVGKVWKSKSLGPVSESGPRAHGPRSRKGHPPTEITLASGRGRRSAMGGLAPQHITSSSPNKRSKWSNPWKRSCYIADQPQHSTGTGRSGRRAAAAAAGSTSERCGPGHSRPQRRSPELVRPTARRLCFRTEVEDHAVEKCVCTQS
jgi:hypothetical protein